VLYRKNLFAWEQLLRVLAGLVVASAPWLFGLAPTLLWVASGAGFALTGVFGFCPACYAIGRRSPRFAKKSAV
jgi:hypothetical protein